MFKATKNTPANLAILRSNRDKLLAATDWCLMPDSPLTNFEQLAVKVYREALRNCTKPEAGEIATLPVPGVLPAKVISAIQAVVLD